MTTCERCGQKWARDPALEVPCPVCGADIGKRCIGSHGAQAHGRRDYAALAAGKMQPCTEGLLHRMKQEEYGPLFTTEATHA